MTLVILAACSGGGDATTPAEVQPTTEAEVGGAIEVAWWGGDARNAKTNSVIDLFVEANEGVTVGRQTADFASYFDRLNVQSSSDTLPCAIQLQNRQVNEYVANDLLLPLEPLVEDGSIDVSNIPESVLDAGRGPDGELYFLPYGVAYDSVGVNVSLVEGAGLEVPAEGYTWEEFVPFLEELSAGIPDTSFALNDSGGGQNFFIGYTLAKGDEVFTDDGQLGFTEEDLVEYWTMWEDMRTNGVTISPERKAEEAAGVDVNYFANGVVATDTLPGNGLATASDTLMAQTGQNATTIAYPSGDAGSGNALYPSGFAIPRTCNNVPTAAAFVDFFTNDVDAGLVFAADNGAPSNSEVLDAVLADPNTTELKRRELELYSQIVEDGPSAVQFPAGYRAVFELAFPRYYEEIAFGNLTVEEAVEQFFAEANTALLGP
ncbi:ABC transporter substrate-binding protein [Cellulomonas sp. KRMCY2]|uniref:ABC transporter substrate-binding protein n=1 Tax=Cellulomonas sp. KRMCY2 TaxID=1304865 RepID=UPI0018CC6936|nr:ABC transporter substrate-binding protein [Cellulomonas sp. KRMCY2]